MSERWIIDSNEVFFSIKIDGCDVAYITDTWCVHKSFIVARDDARTICEYLNSVDYDGLFSLKYSLDNPKLADILESCFAQHDARAFINFNSYNGALLINLKCYKRTKDIDTGLDIIKKILNINEDLIVEINKEFYFIDTNKIT